MREVVILLNLSLGFVPKVVSCHQQYGQITDPRPRSYGRHRAPNDSDLLLIREVIVAKPTSVLDEIQCKLAAVREV